MVQFRSTFGAHRNEHGTLCVIQQWLVLLVQHHVNCRTLWQLRPSLLCLPQKYCYLMSRVVCLFVSVYDCVYRVFEKTQETT